jgi:hypothetical protein
MAAEHRGWINEAFAALSPAQMKSLRRLLSRIEPHKVDRIRKDAA